ncbi:ubiquinone biosynthesis protein COQ4 homolog, mitochondrial-like isoform X2 [Frieseomelitta varia]|uniref:ubiquinone biosynthesis protein COQ4 homolog, mitochondrial-like isoform X2 n=1 Tax=Frieseomelitta varia TaxID=561572 RepID=UPI001CB69CED|nr:ubiquinone biosynthesis protein COQ4 homolog, mitochondrial-like isoform X2 [Frieseomelitta varia]
MSSSPKNAMFARVGSAVFYGLSSFMITVVNKTVLTSFEFPSFQILGIGQMLATIVLLFAAKKLRYVEFPNLEAATCVKIWPLPIIYIVSGWLVRRMSSNAGCWPSFATEYARHRVPLSPVQRAILAAGAAAISLADPFRGDMIACLAETTGTDALSYCRQKMLATSEGSRILAEKPRISSSTVDFSALKRLPPGTLGRIYCDFLDINNVSPDSRTAVRFVEDTELAYVMQRYRETHDIYHALLLMPTTMLGEVSVKWIEAVQLRLPMCFSGAIFGAFRLRPRQRKLYVEHYLPWAINTAVEAKFLLGIYFEERWEQPLDDFHREANIVPLVSLKT